MNCDNCGGVILIPGRSWGVDPRSICVCPAICNAANPRVAAIPIQEYDQIKTELQRLLHECEQENEHLRTALRATRDKLSAITEPWLGIRADLLPDAVMAIVPLINELTGALQECSK